MKLFYTDQFALPLPEGHRFPMAKYTLLRERIKREQLVPPEDLCLPPAVSDSQLLLIHDRDYLARVIGGTLSRHEVRRIGFPWSPAMVERSRRSSGATLSACRVALHEGCAANLAGGTHHAFRDHGEGYCVFNDAVLAARVMQNEGTVQRVAIIDCDVHQGNGTAALVADDPTIFAFSIHGASNYPFRKEPGDLDIALPDNTGDHAYLQSLEDGIEAVLQHGPYDLAIYISGADPYADDKLGRLALSMQGLAERDQLVLHYLRSAGIPTAVCMAGGYARVITDTVAIHYQTLQTAVTLQAGWFASHQPGA